MSAPSLITRRAPLPASSFNRETRTFTAVAATGAPVPRFDWSTGKTVNEVLVISVDAIDLTRLSSGRAPMLLGHRADSVSHQVGVIRGVAVERAELVVTCELSGRQEVGGLADDIAAGVLTNVSIGYRVLASERVPGVEGKPDTMRVTRWEPYEVSLVPVPADPGAYVRSGVLHVEGNDLEIDSNAGEVRSAGVPGLETRAERQRASSIRDFARRSGIGDGEVERALDAGVSTQDFGARCLEHMATRTNRVDTGPAARSTLDDAAGPVTKAIGDALYARMSGKAPEGQAREFMGRSLLEMGTALLEARGERVRWSDRDQLADLVLGRGARGMHTTSDFPSLLTVSGNRVMEDAYVAATTPLRALARTRTRIDFKDVTGIALSEAPRLLKVNEGGEVTYGTRAEESRPLYKVETFARMFSLSRNALINDDLDAFGDALAAFGQGAAQTENDQLAALFLANDGMGVTMFDNKSLYHAGHGNLAAGSEAAQLSVDTLGFARRALRNMKGLDGVTPINVTARHLVVGPDLETQAEKVLTALNATQVQEVNPFPGKLALHVEPRLPGNAWRLFADPAVLPCIEIAYLAGHEAPQLSFREGWDRLGTEFRAVLDFGCGIREWRGTFLNRGA